MKRAYVDTPEGQIHLFTHGRGTPLLLLHESPRSARAFVPMMKRLGSRFRCIAPDMLGFGNSDPLPPGITMEGMADNAVRLLDALDIERVEVFGFHTGNKIGAALAAHHPDRVGRLVLMGMTHSLVVSRKERDAAIMHVIERHMAVHPEHADGTQLLRKWGVDFGDLARVWWAPEVAGARKISAAALARQEACAIEIIQCRHSMRQIYRMNFAFDLAKTVRRIKCPTLVIECRVPQEFHLGEQGPKLVKLLRNGQLMTLAGAGFDATEAFAAQLATAATRFFQP
jgi:pimeloyl-ACP methyl ester carboxylesterase